MLISVYAVKDIKLSEFQRPFLESSAIQASRGFQVVVRDSSTMFNQFPGDFELHEVAKFDNVTGKFESYDTSKFITSAAQIMALDAAIMESEKK